MGGAMTRSKLIFISIFSCFGMLSATPYPNCTLDGEVGCITNSTFKAVDTSSLDPATIATGKTIGGVAGSATVETNPDCTAGNQSDCITTSTYRSADTSAFQASDILSGKTIVGVSGTAIGPPDCSSISVGGTWLSVPGDADYGTNDFCVMKYEAKNNSGVPNSVAAGTPWVSISQLDAITECASLGAGFHLITNDEWMTIATNAAAQGANWDGGIVGTNEMARGHSDGDPASHCEADANDANAYVDGTCTGSSSGTFNQRRTLYLSNGEVIWDLAGNQWEWTNYYNATDKPNNGASWTEYTSVTGTSSMPLTDLIPQVAIDNSWNTNQGLGSYAPLNGGALVRGADYPNGALVGVFAAHIGLQATSEPTAVSFRCALSR